MAADLLATLDKSREARALVITGAGRAFCSGQDLTAVDAVGGEGGLGEHLRKTWHPIVEALTNFPAPTIASINGACAGAGVGLALACDIRIASRDAIFIEAFSAIGLVPDAGNTWMLPRIVGLGRALEMAFTARRVSASEAYAIGLIAEAVEPGTETDRAIELAKTFANGPTLSYVLTRKAMLEGFNNSFRESLTREEDFQTKAGKTSDFVEGVTSFAEKRKPSFDGSPEIRLEM